MSESAEPAASDDESAPEPKDLGTRAVARVRFEAELVNTIDLAPSFLLSC